MIIELEDKDDVADSIWNLIQSLASIDEDDGYLDVGECSKEKEINH